MAAIAQSNFVKTTRDGIAYLLDSASTYVQGQFVKWITASKLAEPAVTNTDGPLVVGVANFSAPDPRKVFGTEVPFPTTGDVLDNGIFTFVGRAAETYKPLDTVVIDDAPDAPAVADGQHIRKQGADGNSNVVGVVAPYVPAAGVAGNVAGGVPIRITPFLIRGANQV
jgi:hypothetical protein